MQGKCFSPYTAHISFRSEEIWKRKAWRAELSRARRRNRQQLRRASQYRRRSALRSDRRGGSITRSTWAKRAVTRGRAGSRCLGEAIGARYLCRLSRLRVSGPNAPQASAPQTRARARGLSRALEAIVRSPAHRAELFAAALDDGEDHRSREPAAPTRTGSSPLHQTSSATSKVISRGIAELRQSQDGLSPPCD